MRDHWDALKTLLAPLGYPTYMVFAPGGDLQYLVLSTPAWDTPDAHYLGVNSAFDTTLRVKAVAGNPEAVASMLTRVRGVLSPGLSDVAVPVPSRNVRVRYARSEFIDVDLDTVIQGTNKHPAFGVDSYHLFSEPS